MGHFAPVHGDRVLRSDRTRVLRRHGILVRKWTFPLRLGGRIASRSSDHLLAVLIETSPVGQAPHQRENPAQTVDPSKPQTAAKPVPDTRHKLAPVMHGPRRHLGRNNHVSVASSCAPMGCSDLLAAHSHSSGANISTSPTIGPQSKINKPMIATPGDSPRMKYIAAKSNPSAA
jgi:hypothetical protein